MRLEAQLRRGEKIYPPLNFVFRALELTPPDKVKVVIVGQDPYHGPGQADGLAFSTPLEKYPPSLKNIFKEALDNPTPMPAKGKLDSWAKNGVLLLNRILTVNEGKALSHAKLGWESLTETLLREIDRIPDPVAFLLWGNEARSAASLITRPERLVLKSSHPSPLSAYRSFLGSGQFAKVNDWLEQRGRTPIDWQPA